MAIFGSIAKFNSCQYFWLHGRYVYIFILLNTSCSGSVFQALVSYFSPTPQVHHPTVLRNFQHKVWCHPGTATNHLRSRWIIVRYSGKGLYIFDTYAFIIPLCIPRLRNIYYYGWYHYMYILHVDLLYTGMFSKSKGLILRVAGVLHACLMYVASTLLCCWQGRYSGSHSAASIRFDNHTLINTL